MALDPVHLPEGTEREVPLNAREVRAVKPTTHQPENRSGKRRGDPSPDISSARRRNLRSVKLSKELRAIWREASPCQSVPETESNLGSWVGG